MAHAAQVRPSGPDLHPALEPNIAEVVSMRRFVMLFTIGAAFAALGAVACGDGNKPPPLTPDTEHQVPTDGAEAGAPETPPAN